MIKESENLASRRALNVIWNAAGRYHFDPGFAAFCADGASDDYFNLVIGLTEKWLGLERMQRILEGASAAAGAEEIAELLWLGVENYVYERELPERPAIRRLRRARADEFFREQQTLSRQQMAMQSMLVCRQMQYRFASVSGRPLPLMNERGRRIAEALQVPGSYTPEEAEAALLAFPGRFFRRKPGGAGKNLDALRTLRRRIASHAYRRKKDLLLIRSGDAAQDEEHLFSLRWESRSQRRSPGKEAEDLAYIRSEFGPCLLSGEQMSELEKKVCTGEDRDVRLWISSPRNEKQYEKNRRYLKEHARMIEGAVAGLSAEIELLLMTYLKSLPEPSRKGTLMPERAYRIRAVRDPKVFRRDGEERDNPLEAVILLDASRSRSHSQEQIAAETYVIAESMRRNRIPVEVCAFRSLRGFTVLEELKKSGDGDCRGILRYYAGGWNRDALVLRAAGELFGGNGGGVSGRSPDRLRVMLVLTDASPNDSAPLSLSGRSYEGDRAVTEAADAVKDLRTRGIQTAAVFHGATAHLESVHRIYGKEYVRIRALQQLSGGVADLLQMVLMERG